MLPQLRVASPCTAHWEKMTGDDRVRYCDQCKLNVYNFSEMSASEIEQLLRKSTGRVCGRLYQRHDGTILTKDCPVGFRAKVRHVSRVAGTALAAVMGAASAAAQNPSKNSSAIESVTGTAGVKLTIVDATGAVIPRSSIVISDQTGVSIVHGESDDVGSYQVRNLKSGSWKITVSKIGFAHKDVTVSLRDLETFQSEITLDVITTTMGVIVEVDNYGAPIESNLPESAFPIPSYIPYSETPPNSVSPPPKPSRNPISRLIHKLHF